MYEQKLPKFLDNYKFIKRLGSGAFGKVMLVTNDNNNHYALKSMSKTENSEQIQYLYQEVKIMKQLRSQYIVQFYDWQENMDFVYILMEYCAGGDLRKDMSLQNQRVYGLDKAIQIMSDIIRGLEIVHSSGFIHRDIKLENILVGIQKDGHKKYKIADFGLSSLESTGIIALGTGHYMSPELFSEVQYGFEVDMWALGVLFYFILNREFPFKFNPYSDDLKDKCQNLVKQATIFSYSSSVKKSKYKHDENCTKNMQDLFKKIFEINKDKRITFSQIRQHPVFKSQFPDLMQQQSKLMYQNNRSTISVSVRSPCKTKKKQLSQLQMNVGLKKSMIRCFNGKFLKQQKILQQKNDEINFLYDNFKQFKDVQGIFTMIQKIPLCYNLAKYYLTLKKNFIKSLKSSDYFKQYPKHQFKQFSKTQSYKKLLSDFIDQYESAKYQFQILHNQCIDCLDQIKSINSTFKEAFGHKISQFQDDKFKSTYRKSTSYAFNKLKLFLKKKTSGNKYNYFYTLIVISHVFNRFFMEKQNYKEVFKEHLKSSENQCNNQINFTALREWMTGASPDQLNTVTKNIVKLYFH